MLPSRCVTYADGQLSAPASVFFPDTLSTHSPHYLSTHLGYNHGSHTGVSKTNLGDHLNAKANFFQKYIMGPLFNTFFSQSSEDGTMGLLKGMMDSKENLESGSLYGPELLMPKKEGQPPAFLKEMKISGPAVKNPVMKFETDQEIKDMLWKASEDATGAKFDM